MFRQSSRAWLAGVATMAGCLLAASSAQAVALYWEGTTAGWDAVANWSTDPVNPDVAPAAIPGINDDVVFNISSVNGAETISLNANQSALSLLFNNTGPTTLQGGGTNRTMTLGAGGLTIASTAGAVTLGSTTANQNVAVTLGASQTWTNNSFNALLIANPLATSGAHNLALAGGPFTLNGGGNIGFGALDVGNGVVVSSFGDLTVGGLTGTGTIQNNSAATKWMYVIGNTDTTFSGIIQNGGGTGLLGLYKNGAGTLTLNGSAASTYTDRTTIYAGTLRLDFANLATPVDMISGSSPLFLQGGRLSILGNPNPANATTQTLGNVTLDGRFTSSIVLNANGGGGTTLNLGAFTLVNDGLNSQILNIDVSAGGTVTSLHAAETLGYATMTDATGAGFARTNGGGPIVRLIPAVTLPAADPTDANTDYLVNADTTRTAVGGFSVNTLTLDSAAGALNLDLGGAANVLTLTKRGLLQTGANNVTITNGQVGAAGVTNLIHAMGPGTLTIGGPVGGGTGNLIKNGPGTLVLTGATSASGNVFLRQGTVIIETGASLTGGGQWYSIGEAGNDVATLTLKGALSMTADFNVGDYANATGTMNVQDGAILSVSNMFVASANSTNSTARGTVNQTGGTVTTGGFNVGGRSTGSALGVGEYNLSAGTLTTARGYLGNNGMGTLNVTGSGVVNVTQDWTIGNQNRGVGLLTIGGGGTLNFATGATKWLDVGNSGSSRGQIDINTGGTFNLGYNSSIKFSRGNTSGANVINQNGGNVTYYSNNMTTVGGSGNLDMAYSGVAATLNTYNLNGGVLSVPQIISSNVNPTRVFNFNGGTLRAVRTDAAFMNLGAGSTRANVRDGGALIDTNGYDVTIAQPLLHSNIAGDAATDGGLFKSGYGALTLTGASTYTGPTSVPTGKLVLSGTGSINNSSGIAVTNYASFVQLSTVASTVPVTLTQGTLDGTGAVGATTVADNVGNIVANGNGGAATLTLGSLTFAGFATANVKVATATPATPGWAVTGTLTTPAVTPPELGKVTLNPSTNSGLWATGLVNLISFGAFNGSLDDFTLGTVSGLNSRQTNGGLVLNGNNIALKIIGDTVKWTGALSNEWSTATLAEPKNWQLSAGGTTDFMENDTVLFDDSAALTSINLASSVSAGNMTFNNSAKDYSLGSAFGNSIGGLGSLTKSGTGTLTVNTYNYYSGGTLFTGGTLNLGTAGALGTGPLTIAAGSAKTLDNTSGSAVPPTASAPQFWNDDFTFTGAADGTHDIDFGAGVVTLGGTGTTRAVTVSAGKLTVGNIVSPAGSVGLTKAGNGTLQITPTAASNIGGDLNVVAGTLGIGAFDFFATGLTGGGTIINGSATTRWVYINNADDKIFTGTLDNGTGGGLLGFYKNGAGKMTLAGTNSYTDRTSVGAGTLEISGNNTAAGTPTFLDGGTLILSHPNALGAAANITIANGTTLVLATDGGDTPYTSNFGTGVTTTLVSGKKSDGVGINHDLGTGSWGGGTVNIVKAANITSGAPSITIAAVGLTSGNAGSTLLLNPTTAVASIGAASITGTANAKNLGLGGSNAGNVVTGPISNGLAGATLSLIKSDTSTWTLTGNNTYTGSTTVSGGTLIVNSPGLPGIGAGNVLVTGPGVLSLVDGMMLLSATSEIHVGDAAGDNATLNIAAGTILAQKPGAASLRVASVAGATGTVNMSGGLLTATGEIWIAPVANTVGTFNLTGGTVNSGGWFVVARDGDGVGTDGNFNMSAGTLNVTGNNLVISSFAGAIGQATISGGTATVTNNAWVGEGGDGTLAVSGTGALVVNAAGQGLRLGVNAGGVGLANLDGGSITAKGVAGGAGTSTFNFNGGTLKAGAASANFLSGLTTINVRDGGATIDSNGHDITVAQALPHSIISGDNAVDGGLTKKGAGTLTLSAASAYTGDTKALEGKLVVAVGGITSNGTAAADTTVGGAGGITAAELVTEHIRQDTLTINAGSKVQIIGATTSVVNFLQIANSSGTFTWGEGGGGVFTPAGAAGGASSGSAAAVPEPATWLLLVLAAAAGLVAARRGRRN